MGLIGRFSEMRMKDPVEGELVVAGITMPDPTASSQNYRIEGVVSGPGVTAQAVIHHGMAATNTWPNIGDHLPVTVDRAKPKRLVVYWERLGTGFDQAKSRAEQLAAQMRGEIPPAGARGPAAGSLPPSIRVSFAPGSQTMDPMALQSLVAMAFGQSGELTAPVGAQSGVAASDAPAGPGASPPTARAADI